MLWSARRSPARHLVPRERLKELARVSKQQARIVLIVGQESNVLGVPFYNADIIDSLRSSSQSIEYSFASKLKITWKEGL